MSDAVIGNLYTFSTSAGGFITVHSGTSSGPVIAFGPSPLSGVVADNATLYPHWHSNASCGSGSSCVTTSVTNDGPSAGCTATTAPGATTGPTEICATTDFTLGLTNVVSESGITYAWWVSTDGMATFNPVGGDSPSITTSQTVESWYYCEVTCDQGTTETSQMLNVKMAPGLQCYCTPTGAGNNSDEILGFALADLNNPSAASEGTNGYMDYTTTVAAANLTVGLSYTASLTTGNGSGAHEAAIWIDYNDNGAFEPGEMVAFLASAGVETTTNFPAFSLPNSPGVHRMRVQYVYNGAGAGVNPCVLTTTYAETEDYLVDVAVGNCLPPVATATVVPNCPNGFGIDVAVADMGDGTSVTINYSVNGTAQTPIVVNAMGTTSLTGFAHGDAVDITVAHEGDSDCDLALGTIQYYCPPANDECADATTLTVNPDYDCGTVTAGTVLNATASGQGLGSCFGAPDDDVWYKFTATGTAHRVSLLNVAGSVTDMYMKFYEGPDCGTMTDLFCSDPNDANLTGLTVGETYYVRVYTYTAIPGQTTTFNICVGTPPPPPANDECADAVTLTVNPDYDCGTVTAGTITSATPSGQPLGSCSGTADDDVWYKFTATSTAHRVSLLNVAGSVTDMYMKFYEGSDCGTMTDLACSDPNDVSLTGLTVGETYYVRVYTYTATPGQTTTFDICVGTAPPPPGCGETWYDTGGPSANYGASENYITTFCPENPGDLVTVTFTSFYTEASWDKLFIYDGPDINSPKLASTNGSGSGTTTYGTGGWWGNLNSNLPGPFTSSSPDGCITFAFLSDGGTQYDGWAVDITCAPAPTCTAPTAVTTGNEGLNSVDVSWTCTTCTGSYIVEYGLAGFTPGTDGNAGGGTIWTGTAVPASPITITGLTASSSYDVYVREMCGPGEYSDNSAVKNFSTLYDCDAAATPITSFPVVNQAVACGSGNYLNGTTVTNTCGASTSYMGGEEALYTFVPGTTDYYEISYSGVSWTGIFVHEGACPSNGGTCVGADVNSGSSHSLTVQLTGGVTYYIWFDVFPSPSSPCPGTFSIQTAVAPGWECDAAIAIPSLPVTNQAVVCTGANNLNSSNVSSCGSAGTSYMGGEEALYTFVPTLNGQHTISYSGVTYTGIFLYANACPTAGGTCVGSASSTGSTNSLSANLTAGVTYYLWIDTWPTPNSPCPGTFSITEPQPAPANDECSGAVALTVNPDLACGTVTSGTVAFATASGVNSCSGTPDNDVWYSFEATSTVHRISLANLAGSPTDMMIGVYSGSCGSLVSEGCSDPETYTIGGLTVGETYFVQVYTYSTASANTTFDICVGTPPPPPANDECADAVTLTVNPDFACATVTAGTVAFATASGQPTGSCGGTPNDDVWYNFTATSTAHRVSLINITGSTSDMYMKFYEGSDCGTMTDFFCSDPNEANLTGLIVGETYYVRVYTWTSTTGQTSAFDICVGTPPPPMDCNQPMTIPYTENFDGVTTPALPECWTVENANGFTTWTTASGGALPGISARYTYSTSGPADDWLISPGLSLEGGVTYRLQYDYSDYLGYPEAMEVYYGTAANAASMIQLIVDHGTFDNGPYHADLSFTPATTGVYYVGWHAYSTTNQFYLEVDNVSVTSLSCDGNQVVVSITTDNWPGETSWEIVDANNTVIASGAPSTSNAVNNETVCLSNSAGAAWYGFKIMDSYGDGMSEDANANWELRTTNGELIMRDEFQDGSSSPMVPGHTASYGAYHSFALPIGAVDIHPDECGIMDNQADNKVYAVKQSGKNYLGQTLNYQFEFLNPDSGRVRRTKKNRNYVLWSELTNPDLAAGVTYYARVRTDKFGAITGERWGAGCEMAMGLPTACTGLIDDPNNQYYSCNIERRFRPNSQIFAWPVYGASKYKFRIYNLGEGYDQEFISNNYKLELSWPVEVAPKLRNGYTYQVQVSALVNGVWTNYCAACPITINNNPSGHMVEMFGDATLWPNPARDGQVNLNIDGITGDVQHITVDVKDIYGQHVYGQEFGNMGERFNTVLDLPGDIATGIYLVNITVNGEVTTKRLSIVR